LFVGEATNAMRGLHISTASIMFRDKLEMLVMYMYAYDEWVTKTAEWSQQLLFRYLVIWYKCWSGDGDGAGASEQ
jgi:hypothetical protein